MKLTSIFKFIMMLFLGMIAFLLFGTLLMCIPTDRYHYEYVDLDNNKGIAQECSYKFEGYRKGGQGSPVCELEDGTVISVKEYKFIFEETYRPIDEIRKS